MKIAATRANVLYRGGMGGGRFAAFLSSMSQEIRPPLNRVLDMEDLLYRTALTVDQRKSCNAIRGSGRQLHSLLSDVLDLAKIEAGKLTMEAIDFDLHAMLTDLGTTYRELAAERGISFAMALDPELRPSGQLCGHALVAGDNPVNQRDARPPWRRASLEHPRPAGTCTE